MPRKNRGIFLKPAPVRKRRVSPNLLPLWHLSPKNYNKAVIKPGVRALYIKDDR